jgi:hypothetical protein
MIVNSFTAAGAAIVIGDTSTNPTVETGTLGQVKSASAGVSLENGSGQDDELCGFGRHHANAQQPFDERP